MNYSRKTKEIVSYIKEQEEKRYGVEFNIDTPTVIEYFINNLARGNFTLVKNSINSIKNGMGLKGHQVKGTNDICVFNRNYDFHSFINSPIRYIRNIDFPMHDICIATTAFHEIRHVLQDKMPNLFTPLERFNIKYLSDYELLGLGYDNDSHDSFYNEIDANFYASRETYKMYKDNELTAEYLLQETGKYLYQKNAFNFDLYFSKLCTSIKEKGWGSITYEDSVFQTFFNYDGSFKRPLEFMSYVSMNQNNDLYTDIITSDESLSSLSEYSLEDFEINWLRNQINKNNLLIDNQIRINDDLLSKGLIDEETHDIGMEILNNRKYRKEEYFKSLENKKTR